MKYTGIVDDNTDRLRNIPSQCISCEYRDKDTNKMFCILPNCLKADDKPCQVDKA